ncbi:thiamine ABC transporter ATP-binding protein [Litoreibacter roseus]|uniref:Thiamine import ATP-binding protein ThiQ n=1 Tax=Litoreibacter roseus TaxID=2601869 RepID=A0A6N6JEX7_9RHOB|nr:thiamine ABC transporter ATP-binding protein [Litoreibacter roseus]GFE64350.1 thiamine import ATP-binding protein ThiQ [Litoreibacter roseus]
MIDLNDVLIRQGAFSLAAAFALSRGTVTAVMGPSGSGKSTLLNAVAGFLPIAQGRLVLNGVDVTNAPPGPRPVSMIFQDQNLFPHLTAAQNVGLGRHPGLKLTQVDRLAVADALDRVGLGGLQDRKPAALSGGQQSRVALARVLLQRRPILLLDEPFAALGPALRVEMLELVRDIASDQDLTVLMVTHDPKDAAEIAPQMVVVSDGVAHLPQGTAALLADPPPALKQYLG